MILLGIGHPMLKEQVISRSGPDNADYRERNPLEMKIADFDDVTYCVKAVDNNLTLFFSMQGVPCCAHPGLTPCSIRYFHSTRHILLLHCRSSPLPTYAVMLTVTCLVHASADPKARRPFACCRARFGFWQAMIRLRVMEWRRTSKRRMQEMG